MKAVEEEGRRRRWRLVGRGEEKEESGKGARVETTPWLVGSFDLLPPRPSSCTPFRSLLLTFLCLSPCRVSFFLTSRLLVLRVLACSVATISMSPSLSLSLCRALLTKRFFFTAVISRFSVRSEGSVFLRSVLCSLVSGLVVSHLRRRGVRHVRITPSTTTRSLIIRTPVCRDAVFPGSVEFSVSEPMAGFCLLATVHRFQPRISVQSYFALASSLTLLRRLNRTT